MLSKVHLTSHSRMSGSRWVITPSWLSGSWRSLYSSSVYSCHLFSISSASVRSIPFLSFIEPIFVWNVPLVALIFFFFYSAFYLFIFLRILIYLFTLQYCIGRSLVFPILLFSSISLHWSLRKPFLSLLAILWNSAFKWEYLSFSPLLFASLLFTAISKTNPVTAKIHQTPLKMDFIVCNYTSVKLEGKDAVLSTNEIKIYKNTKTECLY